MSLFPRHPIYPQSNMMCSLSTATSHCVSASIYPMECWINIDKQPRILVWTHRDLLAPGEDPLLDDEEINGFDLVGISIALHHVEDTELAVRRLSQRLRQGGVLLIVDWLPSARGGTCHGCEQSHSHLNVKHDSSQTIAQSGFTKEQIFRLFELAGCGEPKFLVADQLSTVSHGGKKQLFWARATKLQ